MDVIKLYFVQKVNYTNIKNIILKLIFLIHIGIALKDLHKHKKNNNDDNHTEIIIKSSKTNVHKYRYRVVNFPAPFKDRYMSVEINEQLLENENMRIVASATTKNAINAFLNEKKHRKVHMKVFTGGSVRS